MERQACAWRGVNCTTTFSLITTLHKKAWTMMISAYYHTHHNFMVYGRQGLKSDFGGHDNHHFGNIYAYIGRAMSVTGALAGHEDQFYDNKVIMTGKDVGNPRCNDDVPALLHDNEYYTPDGDLTECG